jgi:perosamine synthetase
MTGRQQSGAEQAEDALAPIEKDEATSAPPDIQITRPWFGPEETAAVARPLESGWIVQGPYVREFEDLFSEYVGAAHSVAASSCTTALHLAVAALKLKAGEEVIVPAFTWVATANVVEYMGARPVFCDIDLATFNVDVDRLESLVTPRTVGILPVHLFGLCADMNRILDFANRHGLWVVEDAACGFGAWYHGRHAGTFGDAGCFSFHPRKSITTGEGGMVTTNRGDIARLCRSLRDHGASRSDLERHRSAGYLLSDYDHVGYNYRMTDLQGALGCVQMARADDVLAARRRLAARYDRLLGDIRWLTIPSVPADHVHGYQSYVCLFRPEEPTMANLSRLSEWRNAVMARLEERGIATRQGTHAPILQGYYRDRYSLQAEDFPNSTTADRISLSLPLFPQMTDDEQSRVVEELKAAFAATPRP